MLDKPVLRRSAAAHVRRSADVLRPTVAPAQPYVSRGPRPRTRNGPCRQSGAVGPCTRSERTTPGPTPAAIRSSTCRLSSRIWVAQAVDSATQVSSPSTSRTGRQCAAISAPTIWSHLADSPAERTVASQCCARTRSSREAPSGAGSRASAAGPLHVCSSGGGGRRRGRRPGAGPPRRARSSKRRAGVRSSPLGSSEPPSAGKRSSDTGDPPTFDVVPRTGQCRRHVAGVRRGDQHLLGGGDELGQLVPPDVVELGEDVVEDEHRLAAVGAQEVIGREAESQRERPRLAVTGVTLRRQVAEGELQLVAVRPDQSDATVELLVAYAGERSG